LHDVLQLPRTQRYEPQSWVPPSTAVMVWSSVHDSGMPGVQSPFVSQCTPATQSESLLHDVLQASLPQPNGAQSRGLATQAPRPLQRFTVSVPSLQVFGVSPSQVWSAWG
jgi:hypothetical protein